MRGWKRGREGGEGRGERRGRKNDNLVKMYVLISKKMGQDIIG